jgi:hypothetical protein
MGDFHRGAPRQLLAVEREQPVLAEATEDLVEVRRLELEPPELLGTDPASRVLACRVDADETKEHLPGRGLPRPVERGVELLGASAERSDHASGLPVALEREGVAGPGGEELGERELEQWQRPRLVLHVGDDLRHETRLEADTHGGSRPIDRRCELVLGGRSHRHHARAHELSELGVAERVVEEVCAQGHEDADARTGIVDESRETVEEPPAHLLVSGEREDLLELVDHEQELRVGGEDPLRHAAHAELVARELVDEIVGALDGHPHERCAELLEGIRAREHVGEQPALRVGRRATPERRDQPCLDHRRLADARRSDDHDEPVLLERRGQLRDEGVAAEELVCVALLERAQSLVRVLGLREGRLGRHDGLSCRVGERRGEGVHRLVAILRICRRCPGDHRIELSRQLGTKLGYGRERPVHRR